MTGLQQTLEADLKQAMRAGDALVRDTVRMVIAAARAREAEQGKALGDDEVREVIANGIKTRSESAEQYAAAGREDLASKERAEADVLRRYLPQQLDEDATRAAVREAIAESGASSRKDLGLVMKALMARHKGRLDGKLAQRLAAEQLP